MHHSSTDALRCPANFAGTLMPPCSPLTHYGMPTHRPQNNSTSIIVSHRYAICCLTCGCALRADRLKPLGQGPAKSTSKSRWPRPTPQVRSGPSLSTAPPRSSALLLKLGSRRWISRPWSACLWLVSEYTRLEDHLDSRRFLLLDWRPSPSDATTKMSEKANFLNISPSELKFRLVGLRGGWRLPRTGSRALMGGSPEARSLPRATAPRLPPQV